MTKPVFGVETLVDDDTGGVVAVYLRVRTARLRKRRKWKKGSFTPIMIPKALFWESSC